MKKVIYFGIFLTLTLYLQACDYEPPRIATQTNPEPEINSGAGSMLILHEGVEAYIAHTRVNGKGSKILLDQASYEIELAKYSGDQPVAIDFSRSSVLLLDYGTISSAGYDINLKSLDEFTNYLVATVSIPTSPCNAGYVLQVRTNPYKFIEINTGSGSESMRARKRVLIREVVNNEDCTKISG